MYSEIATEGKSRHEIITRAKISWAEAASRVGQRDWINRELAEIGLSPLSDLEIRNYDIRVRPQLL